jgi:hypothetical protein
MIKMAEIKISKPEQFHYENKAWERLLEFFKQENAFLKTRLAEVLDQCADRNFLALAEQFQNRFILKDEFIDELRHDIHEQDRLIKEYYTRKLNELDNKVIKKQEKLRNEMAYLESDFPMLKNEFNKYLTNNL